MFQRKERSGLRSLFIAPILPRSYRSLRRNLLVCQQSSPKQVWGRVKKAIALSRAFADRYGESALIPTGPQRFKIVCPFHNDKNPSLHISDDKGTFHCFGCGASGSIIDLEQLASGHRSIGHALKSLSNKYQPIATVLQTASFTTPSGSPETPEDPALTKERPAAQKVPRRVVVTHKAIAYDVLRDATLLYQRVLWDSSSPLGLQYFSAQRRLSAPTLRAFACGYAPPSPRADFLMRKLREAGYPPEQLAIAGVARASREGMIHDLFRDRVIAPIRDVQGRTIALAGRALPHAPKSVPKYINSPETCLFKKKNVLFGADIAKDAPSATAKFGYIIVVEGYMDVMTMFERTQGRIACVATMGTAVTLEQLHAAYKLLDDCVDGKVIVNFDNDDAGIKALNRLCESVVLGASCAHAIYIALPPSPVKDADEFMTEAGTADEYMSYLLDAAKPWYEWYGNRIVAREIERMVHPETDVDVEVDLGITKADMQAIRYSKSSHELDLLLSKFLREQREDLLASVGCEPNIPELAVDPPRRAPCSREVLDSLAAVVNCAAKTLPGLNVSALVHSWTDLLSLGEPARLIPMFAYVIKKYHELAQPWRHLSAPVQVWWMPPPPWIQKELDKKRKKTRTVGSMDEEEDSRRLRLSPQELKRIRERIQFQEQYIMPILRERRCDRSKMTKAAPRRAAEELILRALIFAKEIDRIDALEVLIDAIIRCAQKKLPFWTSKAREGLFEYLSQLEGACSPEEMAAYLEESEWWCEEIEDLFIPIEEEDDPEWAGIRRLEIDCPIDMVETCALSVERMAGMVGTRYAIEKSGDVMQRMAETISAAKHANDPRAEEVLKKSRELFATNLPSAKERDRSNYLNPAESAAREKAMEKVEVKLRHAARKAQIFSELQSGNTSPPAWADDTDGKGNSE